MLRLRQSRLLADLPRIRLYLKPKSIPCKGGIEITLIDVVAIDKDNILDQVHLKMQIKHLYEKLQKTLRGREKIVIEQRYGLGSEEKTQREIAEALDISRSYVSRIEKKALKKLLKAMSE